MRHLKNLQLESKELEVFEVASLLRGFLEDKGIKASVEKFENFFNIYISGYANEEVPKKVPVSKLLAYFKSLGVSEDASIQKTKFGYTIEMLQDSQAEKLMEATEEEEGQVCYICEKVFFGYGNDPWPITTTPGQRVCDQCNTEYVIPARIELLTSKKYRKESVEKSSVEHAASNVVLDDKFIWLFSVLNTHGEDIEEGIEYLQDAIDSLVANDGTFLVAFPYVDPKPEDKSVEIVFADNPGPIIIYNKEESTVSKDNIKRPSQERKVKGESTIAEAEVAPTEQQKAVQGINDVANYLKKHKESLSDKDLKALIDYCRTLLKAINRVADAKAKTESMKDYGLKCLEDDAWRLYNKASDYFPEEENSRMSDDNVVNFTRAALNYIISHFTEEDIDNLLDGDPEDLYEVSKDIFAHAFAAMELPYSSLTPRSYLQKESKVSYRVLVEFEKAFYLEHDDDDIEISQILDSYIAQAEENLESRGVYLAFDYYGGGAYDYISSPVSYAEARLTYDFLNGDSVTIKIISDSEINKGDDK